MDETPPPKPNEGESLQQAIDTGEEMDTGVVADGDIGDSVTVRRLDTFFSSGDVHYHRQFKVFLCVCNVYGHLLPHVHVQGIK